MAQSNNRTSTAATGEHIIGWQGVTVLTPEHWNIGAIGGDRDTGYLRVDDGVMPRLEIKWNKDDGKADMDRIIERYVRELGKKSRRKKLEMEHETGIRLISKRQKPGKQFRTFYWAADQQAYGIVWRCLECNRILVAQATGPPGANIRRTAERIFATLDDHSADGWDLWSVYDFTFQLPDTFRLDSNQLMTGQLHLTFTRGRREKLSVARWGMAHLLLKHRQLDDFALEQLRKRSKGFRVRVAEADFMGGPAVRAEGAPWRPQLAVNAWWRQRVRGEAFDGLVGWFWSDDSHDRIYGVDATMSAEGEALVRSVAESIPRE